MMIPEELTALVGLDRLTTLEFQVPGFAHDDHRFVLPIVHYAQEREFLPRPCKVLMFDRHHDSLAPRSDLALDAIRELRRDGVAYERLLRLVADDLSNEDDDWVRAGMELGMLSDAVVFGTMQTLPENPFDFEDHAGVRHRIFINPGLPGECFGQQGNLSDAGRGYAMKPLWDLLDWDIRKHGFRLSDERVLFDIDLDVFVMMWEDFLFAWRPEVWNKRFLEEADYFASAGWSGKRFVQELLSRVGLMTVAREPAGCGGEAEMQRIFSDFNDCVFDGVISET